MKRLLGDQWHTGLIAALSAVGIFALGFTAASLVSVDKPPIAVERLTPDVYSTTKTEEAQEVSTAQLQGSVVGSVNSDKYHFEHCPGARSIKEENQIWFNSPQEAEQAGYVLAGNCTQ